MSAPHIIPYTPAHRADLLRLLLELHDTYFHQSASPQKQELQQEKNISKSYREYIDTIEGCNDNTWEVLVAQTDEGTIVGFIIGSIEEDDTMVMEKTGILEDWFIMPEYRKEGTGARLFGELEKWFKENSCQQIKSDTWAENDLSIRAHEQLGFFISGVQFSKKL